MLKLAEILIGSPLGVVIFLTGFIFFLLGLLPVDKVRVKRSALINEPLKARSRWVLGVLGLVFMVGPTILQTTYTTSVPAPTATVPSATVAASLPLTIVLSTTMIAAPAVSVTVPPTVLSTQNPSIEITEPINGEVFEDTFQVSGNISDLPTDVSVWIFVAQTITNEPTRYWLQRDNPAELYRDNTWRGQAWIYEGDKGGRFEVCAVAVSSKESIQFLAYYSYAAEKQNTIVPFLGSIPPLEGIVARASIPVTLMDSTAMPTATSTPALTPTPKVVIIRTETVTEPTSK